METETVELEAAEAQGFWLGAGQDQLAGSHSDGPAGAAQPGALPRALSVVRRPTWRIKPGVCTESLALDVARRCRLPLSVVTRAAQLYEQLPPLVPRMAALAGAAAAETAAPGTAAAPPELAPWDVPLEAAAGAGAGASAAAAGQPGTEAPPARRAARGRRGSGSSNGAEAPVHSRWTIEAAAAALQQVAQDALAGLPAGADPGAGPALQVRRRVAGLRRIQGLLAHEPCCCVCVKPCCWRRTSRPPRHAATGSLGRGLPA